MNDSKAKKTQSAAPLIRVGQISSLSPGELQDLCDATDAAIEAGGGFGWVRLPARDVLERYWNGLLAMPQRVVFAAWLDGVICGTVQLVLPPRNNEAQSFAVTLTSLFVAPWARGYGLASRLVEEAEAHARKEGFAVINLDIRETQETAIKLYEGRGYVRIGTHPHYAHVDGKVLKGHYYYKTL